MKNHTCLPFSFWGKKIHVYLQYTSRESNNCPFQSNYRDQTRLNIIYIVNFHLIVSLICSIILNFQVFQKGMRLTRDVSTLITSLQERGEFKSIEDKWLGNQANCIDQNNTGPSNSLTLNLDSFWGLFLIAWTSSSLALLMYAAMFFYEHRHILIRSDPNASFCLNPPRTSCSISPQGLRVIQLTENHTLMLKCRNRLLLRMMI